METPFYADIQITSGRGNGKIVHAYIWANGHGNSSSKYTATPSGGGRFPGGSMYMGSNRWKFVK